MNKYMDPASEANVTAKAKAFVMAFNLSGKKRHNTPEAIGTDTNSKIGLFSIFYLNPNPSFILRVFSCESLIRSSAFSSSLSLVSTMAILSVQQ